MEKETEKTFYSIEQVYYYLKDCKSRGEKVTVRFKDVTINSEDVSTLDDIYLKVYGLNVEDYNRMHQEISEAAQKGDYEAATDLQEKYSQLASSQK